MGSKRPTGLSQLTIDLDRAEKDEPSDSRRRSLTGEIEGCTHIHFAECRQRVRSRLGHHVHPGGAVDDHILPSQCSTPVLARRQITHAEHRNIQITIRLPYCGCHRITISLHPVQQPRTYKAGGTGNQYPLRGHQQGGPSVPVVSITTKQVSRVYLICHILQLDRLPVSNYHVTQLLEGIQVIDYT